jgi:4-diphosphocytidyl-2-C-methyl-D-erythritol kinase
VGAGLGGGSADAAAVLYGLNRLLELGQSDELLMKLAGDLGADVPFFLGGPCALGEGKGERLVDLHPTCGHPIVLIKPSFSISTAWAYGALNSGLTGHPVKPKISYRFPRISWLPRGWEILRNDLETPVMETHPAVRMLKDRLKELGADFSLMSGSGPTVFGWFKDVRRAERAVRVLADKGMFCHLTRTLGAQDPMF